MHPGRCFLHPRHKPASLSSAGVILAAALSAAVPSHCRASVRCSLPSCRAIINRSVLPCPATPLQNRCYHRQSSKLPATRHPLPRNPIQSCRRRLNPHRARTAVHHFHRRSRSYRSSLARPRHQALQISSSPPPLMPSPLLRRDLKPCRRSLLLWNYKRDENKRNEKQAVHGSNN